jgi:hypothetical protein
MNPNGGSINHSGGATFEFPEGLRRYQDPTLQSLQRQSPIWGRESAGGMAQAQVHRGGPSEVYIASTSASAFAHTGESMVDREARRDLTYLLCWTQTSRQTP